MNAFRPTTAALVGQALDDLKGRQHAGKKGCTNYFLQPLQGVANLRLLESEGSLCFLHDEWDFSRAYFCSYDADDLRSLVTAAPWPGVTVTDWISREPPGAMEGVLAAAGFHLHTVYDRMVCDTPRHEGVNPSLSLASRGELDALQLILFQQFDKYADHILSSAELEELIGQGNVIVSRDGHSHIKGFIIFQARERTCNFNFLYHGGNPLDLPLLLGNFYAILAQRGIRSGFGWVRRTRPLVLKLHQSFGWKTDGLKDFIFLR